MLLAFTFDLYGLLAFDLSLEFLSLSVAGVIVAILGRPLLGVFLLAETLVVVALGGEELLEVGLAVDHALHGRVVAQGHDHATVAALEACLVEHLLSLLLLDHCLLCCVDGLVTDGTLLGVQGCPAELRGNAGRGILLLL